MIFTAYHNFKKKFAHFVVECEKVVYLIYQLTTKTKKMNYELKVTETNKKAAKFHYQVIDENGNVICERKSNNVYVYCTINGAFYSGKLGNIEKSTQYKYDLESASDKSKLTTFAYKK